QSGASLARARRRERARGKEEKRKLEESSNLR
ncbi:hypothetical protein A2U01_0075737, partial [Trifolium medium]|nr:hypothetical protein [Trifolium medium]